MISELISQPIRVEFWVFIYPTPPPKSVCDTAGLNSKFSFPSTGCLNKTKEPYLLYLLLLVTERTDGFITFSREVARNVIQVALSRIWTQVIDSIFYNNNSYAKHAS